MLAGYTKSYRAKWENPIFRNLLEAGIWSWMCDTAVWQETKVRFNGKLVTLQRGQLITSLRFMSKGFCVSEQVARTFLNHVTTDGMINTQLTHAGTLVTICNYDKYQAFEDSTNTPTNTALTQHQHSTNTNKKEDKNIRNKEKKESKYIMLISDFDDLWNLYPRKSAKQKATEAYNSAIKKGATHEAIITGLNKHVTAWNGWSERDKQYIPYAATWINQCRWNEEPEQKGTTINQLTDYEAGIKNAIQYQVNKSRDRESMGSDGL